MRSRIVIFSAIVFLMFGFNSIAQGIDTELTRQTISGLPGVNVMVEEMQPNIKRYAQKAGIMKEQIQKDIEMKLTSAGIKVLAWNDWLKTPGRPVLYVNINTHEYEKYWYAYDIKIELKQIVLLEANPKIKTLASTWSIDMTGVANIGTLSAIRNNVRTMTDRFIAAFQNANSKK